MTAEKVDIRRERLLYQQMLETGETASIETVFFFPTPEDQKLARELRRRGIFPELTAIRHCAGRIATTLENLRIVRRLGAGVLKRDAIEFTGKD